MLDEKEKVVLEQNMCKYLDNKEQIDELEVLNKKLGEMILQALEAANEKSYKLDADGKGATFTVATRTKVDYDSQKIKEIVGKKLFAEIADRVVTVKYEQLVELAKKYKIPVQELKDCLIIEEHVNGEKLQYAYDTGKIDLTSLKGTYTIDKKSYLTTRKAK